MALSAGAVVAQFDGDFKGLNKGLQDAQSKINGFTGGIKKAGNKIGESFKAIGEAAINAGKIITVAGVGALTLFSKQAIDQVKQVQSASAGLRAYEKDAGKVSKTLSELVKFAQSDMGVLFQRGDLFDAASTLKLFGAETDDLVKRVKIMSKAVAGGKTTFQDLSTILGRVSASGKLTATDFDMLIERGIGLDKKMRGTSISADKLFEALDKSLPDGLLEGRATSIEGQMVRLSSALRNVGAVFLGVNEEADGFLPGSIGERVFNLLDKIREFARSKEFLDGVSAAAKFLGESFDNLQIVINYLKEQLAKIDWVKVGEDINNNFKKAIDDTATAIENLIDFYKDHKTAVDTTAEVLISLGSAFVIVNGAIKAYNIVMTIANALTLGFSGIIGILTNPITIIIGLIAGLIFVGIQIYKNWEKLTEKGTWLGDKIQWVKDKFSQLKDSINGMIQALGNIKMPKALTDILDKMKGLGNVPGLGNFFKGKLPGFANGVQNFAGGLAIVGERGPELVNLPKGSDVFSNEESKRMVGGQGITIETMNIKSGVDWEVGASYLAQKLRLS